MGNRVSIVRGTLAPFLQNEEFNYDPNRGFIHKLEYKGAGQYNMQLLYTTYVNNGIPCRIVFNQGDTCTLYVDDTTQQYTLDVWQILGNEENRDGLSHPSLLALVTDDDVARMRTHLENQDTPASVFGTGGDLAQYAGTLVPVFYSLQQRGSTEYEKIAQVMAAAQSGGLSKIGFVTEPKK